MLNGDKKDLLTGPMPQKDNYVVRAPRFPIEARMQYREGGEAEWHEGTTINISRSGVLFRAARVLEPRKVLEMRIDFPPEFTGEAETSVVCWGPVVRSQPIPECDGQSTMAASIFHYRFHHA